LRFYFLDRLLELCTALLAGHCRRNRYKTNHQLPPARLAFLQW
jgi:hypothetical protein